MVPDVLRLFPGVALGHLAPCRLCRHFSRESAADFFIWRYQYDSHRGRKLRLDPYGFVLLVVV